MVGSRLKDDGKEVPPMPETDPRQFGYRTARATLSVIPLIGGALQEILDAAIGSPLERRRAEFLKGMADKLDMLSRRIEGFDPKALGGKEDFVDAVYSMTEAAMRTHSEEK